MPMFDNEDVLNMQAEGQMETKFTPVPEGEYPAYVKEVKGRTGTGKDGNEFTLLDITWAIQDDSVAQAVGVEEPTCRQSVFLDFNDGGGLATGPGRNIQLGRLREAVGQNGPEAWSPGRLEGASAIVRVAHSEGKNPGEVYANVTGVAAA